MAETDSGNSVPVPSKYGDAESLMMQVHRSYLNLEDDEDSSQKHSAVASTTSQNFELQMASGDKGIFFSKTQENLYSNSTVNEESISTCHFKQGGLSRNKAPSRSNQTARGV